MKFGSVFAGIGGFEIGLERAGWECAWQIENDKFCTRVLGKGWPSVKRFGDIREVQGGDLERVDLLVGGFPCQDLSIAGKRAGIRAERSGLFFEFVRLARELRPEWLLIENVHGLLSSGEGADFYVVVETLSELGYGVAWRTLDSRYFGVPQRRRRVFVVGHLGGPVPHEVLFDSEGGGGDLAACITPGPELAGTLGGGAPGARGRRDDLDTSGAFIPLEANPLNATFGKHDEDADTLVAYAVRTAQTGANGIGVAVNETHTLDTAQTQAIAFNSTAGGSKGLAPVTDGTPPILATMDVAVTLRMREGKEGGGKGPLIREDESLTLATANDQTLFTPRVYRNVPAAVRRLTPTECERLQGFPDGWTCLCGCDPYSTQECRCPDGPRYAALGNAVTTNVVEWVGRRLAAQQEVQEIAA